MSEICIENIKVKCLIFDLDGTLLDSCKVWAKVDNEFFTKRGLPIPKDFSKIVSSLGLEKASVYTKNIANLKESPEEIRQEWLNGVNACYRDSILTKPHVKEFLEYCKRFNVPMYVATANSEDCFEPCLKRNKIYHYFDFFADIRKYANGKRTPDIFLDLAKKANLNPSDIMIFDDSMTVIKVAKAAGFKVCAIKEEAWASDEEEKRQIADVYIDDFGLLL